MKCNECGGEFLEKFGSLKLHDNRIGNYQVNDIQYYKCNECDEVLFPATTLRIIEEKESEVLSKLIGKLPIDEFIGATEAAEILGISRQAIHKHKRIRRGFIYSKIFEGRRVYDKKSLEMFKRYGDGRYPLKDSREEPQVKFVVVTQTVLPTESTFQEFSGEQELHDWFIKENMVLGKDYAKR